MVYHKIIKWKYLILFLGFMLCLFFTFCSKWKVETNLIKAVLPQNIEHNTDIVKIADKSNSIIRVVYVAEDEDSLYDLKSKFRKGLDKKNFTDFNTDIESLLNIYRTYPTIFLSKNTRKILRNKGYDEIHQKAIEQLYNPVGFSIVDFDKEPYFLLTDFLTSQNIKTDTVSFIDNKYYDVDTVKLKNSDGLSTGGTIAKVKSIIKLQHKLSNNTSKIYLGGTPIHSYYTSKYSTVAINLICLLSTLLIGILTYLYFKKIKILIPIALSIILGFWAGVATVKYFFADFHIITLVFGTTLIGIGIDYSYHYLFNKNKVDSKFLKSITFSILSTVLAFLMLFLSDIELLKQISVFTIVGLITIYLIVLLTYPAIQIAEPRRLIKFQITNAARKITYVFVALLILLGFLKLKFNDTITAFYEPSNNLKQVETLYSKVTNPNNEKNYIIATKGKNINDILQNEETTKKELSQYNITTISMSDFIPSQKLQMENIELVQNLYNKNLNSFNDLLLPEQILMLKTKQANLRPIKIDNVSFTKDFLIDKNTSLMYLKTNNSNLSLHNKNSKIIDISNVCRTYLITYRKTLLKIIPCVFILLYVLLCAFYKIKLATKMILPPTCGSLLAIAVASLLGQPITMFSLIAIFLILGFTLDYSIFRANSGEKSEDAIFISCMTTAFSFLALSFTSFKFVSSVSLILFIGIITSYLLGLMIFSQDTEQ